jgi:hypothetical protein
MNSFGRKVLVPLGASICFFPQFSASLRISKHGSHARVVSDSGNGIAAKPAELARSELATVLFLKPATGNRVPSAGTEEVTNMEWMKWEHVLLSGYVREIETGAEVNLEKVQEYLDLVRAEVLRQSTSAPESEQETRKELGPVISDEIQKMRDDSDNSLKARVQWTAMVETLQSAHDESGPVLDLTEVLDWSLKERFVLDFAQIPADARYVAHVHNSFHPSMLERKNKVRDLLYAEVTGSQPGRSPCGTPTDTARLVAEILQMVTTKTGSLVAELAGEWPVWGEAQSQVQVALKEGKESPEKGIAFIESGFREAQKALSLLPTDGYTEAVPKFSLLLLVARAAAANRMKQTMDMAKDDVLPYPPPTDGAVGATADATGPWHWKRTAVNSAQKMLPSYVSHSMKLLRSILVK